MDHQPVLDDYSHTIVTPCPECDHTMVHGVAEEPFGCRYREKNGDICSCDRRDLNTFEPRGYTFKGRQLRHHAHCSCGWEGMFPDAESAQRGLDGHEAVMATILGEH